jgi:hypothetical protein
MPSDDRDRLIPTDLCPEEQKFWDASTAFTQALADSQAQMQRVAAEHRGAALDSIEDIAKVSPNCAAAIKESHRLHLVMEEARRAAIAALEVIGHSTAEIQARNLYVNWNEIIRILSDGKALTPPCDDFPKPSMN